MYIRLSFDDAQKLTSAEIRELSKTLADEIKYIQLYKKHDGDIEIFYAYSNTLDPNDPLIAEGKRTLAIPVDLFLLDTNKEYFADMDLFLSKHPNIKIKIRGIPKSVERDYGSVIAQIIAVQEKFEEALKSFDKQVEFNQKCDVHIANLGLLHINQLGYIEDACTDSLQELLNKGWRIVACCVQPDQRRPDYILGRYNPDQENATSIKF